MEFIKPCSHGITDVCHCLACEICELKFDRRFLETVSIPNRNAFISCQICALQEKNSYYRLAFEKERDSNENLKTQLDLFRQIGLRPEKMAQVADNPESELPSVFIERKIAGLEKLSFPQIQYWLELFSAYTAKISEVAGRKASKEEIQAYLQEKTKKAITQTVQKQKEEKEKKERAKPLTPFQKAVKSYMSALKLTEEKAKAMCLSLGMKEE